jgi:aldehyde:ferredoxin oxidoreductase
MRRIDEKPPEDHWAVRDHDAEQKLLDAYYEFKGWTPDGIPTKETLDKLGMSDVSEDLIKRGILTGNESATSRGASAETEKKNAKGASL